MKTLPLWLFNFTEDFWCCWSVIGHPEPHLSFRNHPSVQSRNRRRRNDPTPFLSPKRISKANFVKRQDCLKLNRFKKNSIFHLLREQRHWWNGYLCVLTNVCFLCVCVMTDKALYKNDFWCPLPTGQGHGIICQVHVSSCWFLLAPDASHVSAHEPCWHEPARYTSSATSVFSYEQLCFSHWNGIIPDFFLLVKVLTFLYVPSLKKHTQKKCLFERKTTSLFPLD